jgi:hypothetical protein
MNFKNAIDLSMRFALDIRVQRHREDEYLESSNSL